MKKSLTEVSLFPMAGEVARRWNQILPSLLNTFQQLKQLGFAYYNGKITVIHPSKLPQIEEVSDNA